MNIEETKLFYLLYNFIMRIEVDILNIFKYVSKIELEDRVVDHLRETEVELMNFIKKLYLISDESRDVFLFDAMVKENISSFELENGLYSPTVVNYCQGKLSENSDFTEEMIKNLNKCVLEGDKKESEGYRNVIAWVGCKDNKLGIENARYVAPPPSEIDDLMKQFVNYCNLNDNFNPIIKSAIIHILFIKIHPFADGNGRTARIIHHHKLTELINNKYGTNFNWPIINLSKGLDLTRGNYYEKENNIIFDESETNYESWNSWFDYILNKIDDNLFYYISRMEEMKERFEDIDNYKNTKNKNS